MGNRFRQSTGDNTIIRTTHTVESIISDNKFESDVDVYIFSDGDGSTGNIIKQNTYFAPNASADPVDEDDGSIATENYVYDTEAETWI